MTREQTNMSRDTPDEARRAEWVERVRIRTAVGVITMGCCLIAASLIIPPPGVIDNSVLVSFGELATLSGTLFGFGREIRRKKDEKNR